MEPLAALFGCRGNARPHPPGLRPGGVETGATPSRETRVSMRKRRNLNQAGPPGTAAPRLLTAVSAAETSRPARGKRRKSEATL